MDLNKPVDRQMTNRFLDYSWLYSLIVQGIGLVVFLAWLTETDFMFGHFSGPKYMIITATFFAFAGILLFVCWIYTGIKKLIDPTRESSTKGQIAKEIIKAVSLIALTLLSCIIILIGVCEWLDIR